MPGCPCYPCTPRYLNEARRAYVEAVGALNSYSNVARPSLRSGGSSTSPSRALITQAPSGSGAVTIRYRTLDQLDLICQRLTGGGI